MEKITESLASEIAKIEVPMYDGYPFWRVLLCQPMREHRAVEWLARAKVAAYLPQFVKWYRIRGRRTPRTRAAIPGMIFVPEGMIVGLPLRTRDHLFDLAGVRFLVKAGESVRPTKADIEIIRTMEARLNLPQAARGVLLALGQRVTFSDPLFAANWGGGVVIEICGEGRIGVEVDNLFGRATKVYLAESEIEAM